MNEQEFNELCEAAWRRELTPVEEAQVQAYLRAHPEVQGEWEREAGLNQLLGELADAPVSSNFTSQVLHAVERDRGVAVPASWARQAWGVLARWRRLAPQFGWGLVALVVALLGYRVYEHRQQQQLEQGVVLLVKTVDAAPVPDPAVFGDFESIRRLPPVMDEDLWVALQP